MRSWTHVAALDLRREARDGRLALTLVALALVVTVLGRAALHDLDPEPAAAGTLWTVAVLVAALGLVRSFQAEAEAGTLEALLALPIPRTSLLAGKAAAGLLLVVASEAAALAVLAATSPIPLSPGHLAPAGAVLLLGTAGLVVAATLLGAVSHRARARELLAPVLVVPVAIPVVVAGVHGTTAALARPALPASEATFLAGYDLVLAGVALLLADPALEA